MKRRPATEGAFFVFTGTVFAGSGVPSGDRPAAARKSEGGLHSQKLPLGLRQRFAQCAACFYVQMQGKVMSGPILDDHFQLAGRIA